MTGCEAAQNAKASYIETRCATRSAPTELVAGIEEGTPRAHSVFFFIPTVRNIVICFDSVINKTRNPHGLQGKCVYC